MHPYRMQALIKQRGKDKVANVAQRNSVYQTIDALLRAGLIKVRETSQETNHPERTVYEASGAGRQALRSWIRAGLSTPAREFPEFPAVLSVPYGLDGPDDMRALLEMRVAALQSRLSEVDKPTPGLPRMFLLEDEYMAAVLRAEMKWLRSVIGDLESGKLAFPSMKEMLRLAAEMGGPSEEAVRAMAAEVRDGAARKAARPAKGQPSRGKRW